MLTGYDLEGRIDDWPRVKAQGVAFVVTRVVGENGAVDPDAVANIAGARSIGILAGGYDFVSRGTTVEDCKRFKGVIAPFLDEPFVVQLDWETPNAHDPATYADVVAWVDEWQRESAFGRITPLTYGNAPFLTGHLGGHPLPTPELWLADYASSAPGSASAPEWAVVVGGRTPAIWQYDGTVGRGVGAAVDLNVSKLTLAQLRAIGGAVNLYSTPGRTTANLAVGSPYYDAPGGRLIGTLPASRATDRFDVLAQDTSTSPAWVLIDGAWDPVKFPNGVLCRWVLASALRNVRSLADELATAAYNAGLEAAATAVAGIPRR